MIIKAGGTVVRASKARTELPHEDSMALNNYVGDVAGEEYEEIMKDTFYNMGYSDFHAKLDKISIEGKEFTCLYSTGEIDGLKAYQKVFPIKCNGYLANITITTYGEDTVDKLAEKFYFVE